MFIQACLSRFLRPSNAVRTPMLACLMATILATGSTVSLLQAEEIGEIGVDWLGNDIIIAAVADPKIAGVTCHLAFFERGVIDRLQKGKWFEDPSNSSVACHQTGPIVIGDIEKGKGGEEVFSKRQSLIWKSVSLTRVYDQKNNALVYLAHAEQVQNGSAKMSVSVVPLYRADVTWKER